MMFDEVVELLLCGRRVGGFDEARQEWVQHAGDEQYLMRFQPLANGTCFPVGILMPCQCINLI
jgi:hypothetical protein